MSKHTFEMEWEQVDAIIIAELKDAYARNSGENRDDELCRSIENVLQYFMYPTDFENWQDARP